jgi:hypothetical protein
MAALFFPPEVSGGFFPSRKFLKRVSPKPVVMIDFNMMWEHPTSKKEISEEKINL